MNNGADLITVSDLTIEFPDHHGGWVAAVDGVSFSVPKGRTLGIVGESGSGKTVTAFSLLGLTEARGGRVRGGRVVFDGVDLTKATGEQLRSIRGNRISMIFQQPTRNLNPAFTVGAQIAETVRRHRGLSRREAWRQAVDALDNVGIPGAAERAKDYPHMFSGGMCQRVMIAMALVCEPDVVVADEPTTALDVTVQSRILDLLASLQADLGISIVFISHDLRIVAEMCDEVAVMYAGQIVEQAPATELFVAPAHPYTAALLGSLPRRGVRELVSIPGSVPIPGSAPSGCRFRTRCAYDTPGRCDVGIPPLDGSVDHVSRCVRRTEIELAGVGF